MGLKQEIQKLIAWNRAGGSEKLDRIRAISRETLQELKDAQIPLNASGLAYTTILSIVPLLAVSFSIFNLVGGLDKYFPEIESLVLSNLAEGTGQTVISQIRSFIGNIHAGALGLSGFLALIVTSMSMLSSAEKTINRVWKTSIQRTLFHRIAVYWLIITVGPLGISVLIGVAGSNSVSNLSSIIPRSGVGYLATFAIFFAIYKWVPNQLVKWIPATTAAAYSTILWSLAKFGYSIYTKEVVSYSRIYGSLGAIPIFLIWIYIVWLIVLSGAALAAVIQKRVFGP